MVISENTTITATAISCATTILAATIGPSVNRYQIKRRLIRRLAKSNRREAQLRAQLATEQALVNDLEAQLAAEQRIEDIAL